MKNKKWLTLASAVVLAVTALPATAFAEKKDSTDDKMLTKITLNNCASHSRYLVMSQTRKYETFLPPKGVQQS